MPQLFRVLSALALVALAGCSMGPTNTVPIPAPDPGLKAQPSGPAPQPIAKATQDTAASALTDIGTFLDAAVVGKLTAKDKTEAVAAQYYALMYGRPGAPRAWAGDKGTTGQVIVGPYVTVNNINCRDFTHSVMVAGGSFSRKGTACRDANDVWSVS